MSRPDKWSAYLPQMIKMYVEDEMSCNEISRALGVSDGTVRTKLRNAGITIVPRPRNPNEGRTPEQQAEINARISDSRKGKGTGDRGGAKIICENCGVEFPAHSRGTRFCSRECKNAVVPKEYTARKRAEYEAQPRLCGCGNMIPYEKRDHLKHCSDECRLIYTPKQQADPAKYKTFNCLNCGIEVTRYKKYGNGYNKYCSNPCAQRHTKVKKHYGVDGLEIVFDSSYEAFFWGACMIAKIPIERFDRQYAIEWIPGQFYAPDFWLPTHNLAVETKGLTDESDPEKWRLFRDQCGPLLILTPDKMREFTNPLRQRLETIHRLGLEEYEALVLS